MVIDQILIKVGSGHNMISLDDWKGMGLQQRIEIINEGRVEFLAAGQPVAVKEALAAIKATA